MDLRLSKSTSDILLSHSPNIVETRMATLRSKISTLTAANSPYALAKRDVDALRVELGQNVLPTVQSMIEEKGAGYLRGRLEANSANSAGGSTVKRERERTQESAASGEVPVKRPRGRPKGSRNKKAEPA